MGWNDHIDDGNELSDLPSEAWGNIFDVEGPFDPDDGWLESAEREEQLIAMRGWFCVRFCDPAHETPYNSREGGFLFVNGGPFNPSTELHDRFEGIVDDELIQEVVDELICEVGEEWAPIRSTPPDDYDERFDFHLVDADESLRRVHKRLDECRQVLELEGGTEAVALARRLVFGAVIGVLESFLWELSQHLVDSSEEALRGCVTKLPVIRDQSIKLGEVFDRHDGIRDYVKGYLQNTIWHRWDKVGPIYRDGLGVKLPSMKVFDEALVKRHDIVHRSGHTKDGVEVDITQAEIEALSKAVRKFATEVMALAKTKLQEHQDSSEVT